MLKHTVKLECTLEDKEGHFICDHDTPIHIAKEMLFQFMKHLGIVEDQMKSQQKEATAQAEQITQEQIVTPQE
jgi:hypothetical protein